MIICSIGQQSIVNAYGDSEESVKRKKQERKLKINKKKTIMRILSGIEIIGKSLWLKKSKTLVIADLHIGYEEALNKEGILVPRSQFKKTKQEIEELLKKVKPKTIVINGDLKHEFGEISQQEWWDSSKILELLLEKCKDIILVRGNHDKILDPIAEKKKIKIVDYYCLVDVCILHGDKIINKLDVISSKILIIGHEHPAITLTEGPKVEKYKCFLFGKYKRQKLIVMPSFLPIIEGTDILKEKLLSPYLHRDLINFEVFILGDKIYKFGTLKELSSFWSAQKLLNF